MSKLKLGMAVYFTTLGNRVERFLRPVAPGPADAGSAQQRCASTTPCSMPNPGQTLMTQMTAQVFFVLAAAEDAVIVPITAVTPTARPAGDSRPSGAGSQSDGARQPGSGPSGPRPAGTGPRPAGQGQPGGPGVRNGAFEQRSMQRREGQEQRNASRSFATVRVIDERGRIEERNVELGVSNRVSVQVLGGVEPGEKVIIGSRRTDGQRAAAEAPRFPPPGPRL